jgi:hypothetical protein
MSGAYTALADAATIAYGALRELMHPEAHRVSAVEYEEAVTLIASHIAIVLPVFGRRGDDAPLGEIPRREVSEGHFRHGARRLEFDDARAPYTHLAVRRMDLEPVLERLRLAYAPPASPRTGGAAVPEVGKARA